MTINKNLYSDIQDAVTKGGAAAAIINDNKRAVNEVIDVVNGLGTVATSNVVQSTGNSTTNVMSQKGVTDVISDFVMQQDLADPDKGAAMVARGVVAVDSIADLLALPEGQRKEGLRYLVKGYHAGSGIGGGEFYFDADRVGENDDVEIFDGFVRTGLNPISITGSGAIPGDDIKDALTASVSSGRGVDVDVSGTLSSTVHVPSYSRITGSGEIISTTVNVSALKAYEPLGRVYNPSFENLRFALQPAPTGSGTENNNHPLHLEAADFVHINGIHFRESGLNLGLKRGDQGTPGGRGTHSSVAMGVTFDNPKNLCVEFMDSDTTGNVVSTLAARLDVPASGGHFARMNGRNNSIFGASVYGGGVTTPSGVTLQGGHGHMVSGLNATGCVQAIRLANTESIRQKYSHVGPFIARSPRDFGLRATDTESVTVDGIIYSAYSWGEEPVGYSGLGAYVLQGCSFNRVRLMIEGTRAANAGADHSRIEGQKLALDIMQRGSRNGTNGIHLTGTSSRCFGQLHAEKLIDDGAVSGSARSVRIDGQGHSLRVMSQGAVISGSGHILEINNVDESVVISASGCIVSFTGSGSLVISGSGNDVRLNTPDGTTVAVSGDNNRIHGIRRGSISITGANNTDETKLV